MSFVLCVYIRVCGCEREVCTAIEPHEFRLYQRHSESYNRGAQAEVLDEIAIIFSILRSAHGSEVSSAAGDFECVFER